MKKKKTKLLLVFPSRLAFTGAKVNQQNNERPNNWLSCGSFIDNKMCFFKKNGPSLASFCLFLSFQTSITILTPVTPEPLTKKFREFWSGF